MDNQRTNLLIQQDGKCHWCGCIMTPNLGTPKLPSEKEFLRDTMITIEHINDLNHNKTRAGERVAACYKCNINRGRLSVKLKLAQDRMKAGKIPSKNCKGYT